MITAAKENIRRSSKVSIKYKVGFRRRSGWAGGLNQHRPFLEEIIVYVWCNQKS